MRALSYAAALLLALAFVPAASAGPVNPGGGCDGLVDVLCGDPWGTPGGTICVLAVGGHCLTWVDEGPGGACDGLVDTVCGDPYGTPGGAICLLAVGGHCIAWI